MSLKSKKKESLIEDEKGKELLIEKPEVLFEEKTTRERERFLIKKTTPNSRSQKYMKKIQTTS